MSAEILSENQIIERFETLFNESVSDDPQFQAEQQKAWEHFKKLGLPTRQHENWKYSNVMGYSDFFKDLKSTTKKLSTERKQAILDLLKQDGLDLTHGSFCFVFNGKPEVFDPTVFTQYRSIPFNNEFSAFEALNFAFQKQPFSIKLPEASLDAPVYFLNITDSAGSPLHAHTHLKIIAPENCTVTIIEIHLALGDTSAFSNNHTTLTLHENAKVTHAHLQIGLSNTLQITSSCIEQASSSTYKNTSVLIGGRLNRLSSSITLNGEQAESTFHGLEMNKKNQKSDMGLTIKHNTPKTKSATCLRGIMKDNAKGAFTGKIIVAENAHSTQADLENKNLLLSEAAEMNTRPQLEIYNDDVVCTHGATIGQLDPVALFYLRSRGLSEAEAKQLLIDSFMEPILDTLPEAIAVFTRNQLYGTE